MKQTSPVFEDIALQNETVESEGDLMIPVEGISAGPSGHTSHSQCLSQQ